MQYVNIRHNRHDGTVAPHVSLGRSRPDLKSVVLDEPRTSAQILAESERAQAEADALLASRPDMLLTGSPQEVAALDASIELARIRMLQANTQHAAALAAEAEAKAQHEAEQTRRKALRKAGMKASVEAGKLADRYVVMAQEMAGLLSQLREQEQIIAEANRCLPDGTEPVPPGEPFNGMPGTPTPYETQYDLVWVNKNDGSRAGVSNGKDSVAKRIEKQVCIPGTPDRPHVPLSHRVTLPGLGRDAPRIWGGIPYPITSNTGR
jgi:hypothetical protein